MKQAVMTSIALLFLSSLVVAAPGWRITKPPVSPGPTGPDNDPGAVQGQWFIPRQSPLPVAPNRIGKQVRPWEFYDDSKPQGGGFMGFLAIRSGTVNYYDRDSGGGYNTGADGILDTFGITITVTNDCPAVNPATPGTNLHQERWQPPDHQWICNMRKVKVTAEFSVDINNGFPAAGAPNPPYVPVPPGIIVYRAVNHDELAWYSFNQAPPGPENFWVPTWDLGDIDHDQSSSKEMQFYVGNAGLLAAGMPLRAWLGQSPVSDLFYNRTESLKISDWVSPDFGPGGAGGVVQPAPVDNNYLYLSNVSVFFVPEPATLLLILPGAVLLLRRRRK